MVQIATGKDSFNKEDVWAAIEQLAGSTDAELGAYPDATAVLAVIVQLYAYMEKLGICEIHYKCCNGCTPGILSDPEFWN